MTTPGQVLFWSRQKKKGMVLCCPPIASRQPEAETPVRRIRDGNEVEGLRGPGTQLFPCARLARAPGTGQQNASQVPDSHVPSVTNVGHYITVPRPDKTVILHHHKAFTRIELQSRFTSFDEHHDQLSTGHCLRVPNTTQAKHVRLIEVLGASILAMMKKQPRRKALIPILTVIGARQSGVCHGSVIVSQNTPEPERSGVLPPPKSRLGVEAGDNGATWRRRQVKAKER
ncbi:hypothetical protein BJV74DRAFT_798629 [Russula compacta]|nr:hypothetical protein BJV74DRAFT_798629 [Russula compacta]